MIYGLRSSILIDGNALRNLLRGKGIDMSKASRKLGKADCYIAMITRRGSIRPEVAKTIKQLFDIDLEEYAKKEESEAESDILDLEDVEVKEVTAPVGPAQTVTIDYNLLYQTIYTAVYHAIAKWELNKDQRKDMEEAV